MPIADSVSASSANIDSSTLVNRGVESAAPTTSVIVPHVGDRKIRIELANGLPHGGRDADGSPGALTTSVIARIGLPTDLCHCVCGT